jgi:hypothetical protein
VPFLLAAVLGYFIVARVTRFLNSDYLAADFRAWVFRRFGDGKIFYLITCPWCASIWVALPVSLAVSLAFGDFDVLGSLLAVGGLWGAYSYVHGLVTLNLDKDEE